MVCLIQMNLLKMQYTKKFEFITLERETKIETMIIQKVETSLADRITNEAQSKSNSANLATHEDFNLGWFAVKR